MHQYQTTLASINADAKKYITPLTTDQPQYFTSILFLVILIVAVILIARYV